MYCLIFIFDSSIYLKEKVLQGINYSQPCLKGQHITVFKGQQITVFKGSLIVSH